MNKNDEKIVNNYFKWLCNLVCTEEVDGKYYNKLFAKLHGREFVWLIPIDENRAIDGIGLRTRFADENNIKLNESLYPLDGPCSVLEMMVALSIRCDIDVMYDPNLGERAGDWFWCMISNLGLFKMDDGNFDNRIVELIINKLLDRTYGRNGEGGMFLIRNAKRDLRKVDIWYQMLWYVNSL